MRSGLLVLCTAMLTACATTPEEPLTAAGGANEEGLVCTKSIPTGSFLPERRCTTAAEREAARRQNDVLIDARNERDSGIR
jgi:hypothetical protein